MKAAVVKKFGDQNSIEICDVQEPELIEGHIIASTRMIGVNYSDTHQTENTYLVQKLPPIIPGGTSTISYNNKKFVCITSSGAYAEKILVNKNHMFEIPEGILEEEALACISQGMTAYNIVNDVCKVKSNDLVLINAASSVVSMFLIQMCKNIGATVAAVTSGEEKINFVKSLGADILIDESDLKKYKDISPSIIIDSYGGQRFLNYYRMLKPGGIICAYGSSYREKYPSLNILDLVKDSKTISGFWVKKSLENLNKFNHDLNEIFNLILSNKIKIKLAKKFNLEDCKTVHFNVRNRNSIGKSVLINKNEIGDYE